MKHIADLKTFLEERIAELKEEIEALTEELDLHKKALEGVDTVLSKESFKSAADMIKKPEEPKFKPLSQKIPEPKEKKEKEEIPIKNKDGLILGTISIFGETISIIPEENMLFSIKAPPFRSFFEGKILKKMETDDDDAIREGKILKEQKISINILKDEEDNIRNIIIQNFRKYDRRMDIINTITWTFRTIFDEQAKASK